MKYALFHPGTNTYHTKYNNSEYGDLIRWFSDDIYDLPDLDYEKDPDYFWKVFYNFVNSLKEDERAENMLFLLGTVVVEVMDGKPTSRIICRADFVVPRLINGKR